MSITRLLDDLVFAVACLAHASHAMHRSLPRQFAPSCIESRSSQLLLRLPLWPLLPLLARSIHGTSYGISTVSCHISSGESTISHGRMAWLQKREAGVDGTSDDGMHVADAHVHVVRVSCTSHVHLGCLSHHDCYSRVTLSLCRRYGVCMATVSRMQLVRICTTL